MLSFDEEQHKVLHHFVASSGGGEAAFDTAGSGPTDQPSFVDPDNRALNALVVATASTPTALGYYQAHGGVFDPSRLR